jgi:hypothetical protein
VKHFCHVCWELNPHFQILFQHISNHFCYFINFYNISYQTAWLSCWQSCFMRSLHQISDGRSSNLTEVCHGFFSVSPGLLWDSTLKETMPSLLSHNLWTSCYTELCNLCSWQSIIKEISGKIHFIKIKTVVWEYNLWFIFFKRDFFALVHSHQTIMYKLKNLHLTVTFSSALLFVKLYDEQISRILIWFILWLFKRGVKT